MEKELLFPNSASSAQPSRWRFFDPVWYSRHYAGLEEAMRTHGYQSDEFLRFYLEKGAGWGHSPNMFFDEIWFRSFKKGLFSQKAKNPPVSGFALYCEKKGLEKNPHWLFQEDFYVKKALKAGIANFQALGFENGWAHYLAQGEKENLPPSPFFDLELAGRIARRFPAYFKGKGLLEGWLGLPAKIADMFAVSWYFDPRFYLEQNPQAREEIKAGYFANALHRYLFLAPKSLDNPCAYFEEEYYRAQNPDILPFIARGDFRNGFDHFLRCGIDEGRAPKEGIDLKRYGMLSAVRSQCESGCWDSVFACFAAEKSGSTAESGFFSADFSEAQTKQYFRQKAHETAKLLALRASGGRPAVDFSTLEAPALSVVLVGHNQADLTLQTLFSLRQSTKLPLEVLVVNSGSSDFTLKLEAVVKGIKFFHFKENIGYLRACNLAFQAAGCSKILLLNNDIRLFPQAVENGLRLLEADSEIGAVCARVVRTNMVLQEAGSVLWQDGSAYGYRREDSPNLPEALFRRGADYGSGAFLFLSRPWVEKAGGTLFDETYLPAYFEDTDLCVRLRKVGAKIIYEPGCLVEHLEFGTAGPEDSHTLIQLNLRKFIARHQAWLQARPERHAANAIKARDPDLFGQKGKARRSILFIEDYIPRHSWGSGYGRSADIIASMARLGWTVTVFPIFKTSAPLWQILDEFPPEVEVMSDYGLEDLAEFLADRKDLYDVVWVGRTHNWQRVCDFFKHQDLDWASVPVILDTEVVAAPRTLAHEILKKNFEKEPPEWHGAPEAELRDVGNPALRQALEAEFKITHDCAEIICVNAQDAALAREVVWPPVKILGHMMPHFPIGGGFETREGFLFVGALHHQDSPNYDSLLWLTQEILPRLDRLEGGEPIKVTIAGFLGEGVDLLPLSGRQNLHFLGAVEDIGTLFNQHRVFLAPTRYAGGLPFKLHEAAARGVPFVATDILQQQLGWKPQEGFEVPQVGDSEAFAQSALSLYKDSVLWEKMRQTNLQAVSQDCGIEKFQTGLSEILEGALENSE